MALRHGSRPGEQAGQAIRVLPPDVAARIAAGEVVERPASVVKELVENALDAGASRIAVEVRAGGLDSIRVTDDGCGIAAAELATAFERHATSKLDAETADLARILTLGFRGEALPSIAAVAEVEMASRPPGAQAAAVLRLVPGAPPEGGQRGAPAGTSVGVRRLFARLPARRQFLRSAAAESSAIAAVVSHYALAYPEVRFSLLLDGRESLATPGNGDLRDAVAAVYGADVAGVMLAVRDRGQETGDTNRIAVSGLVAPPQLSRASRGYVSLFVNRRWIQSRRLAFAVEEAYRGMLMTGRHPIAVLNLRVPHEEVDVNVHPAKAEVRFRDESAVFGALQRAVRQALVAAAPVPALAPPGSAHGARLALASPPWTPPLWEHALRVERGSGPTPAPVSLKADPPGSEGGSATLGGSGFSLTGGGAAAPTPALALPVLRVIGQFGSLYIIAEGPDGMYLIDQHAAHERVLYERFCAGRERGEPDVQGLLEALALEPEPLQRALLAEQAEALRGHGFDIEPFGEGAFVLRALPRALAAGDVRESVLRFLDLLLEEEEGDRRDRVAMSLACHGAVRAGKTLALEEMRELVRQLEESESPHTCPHGRPVMLHMSAELLARQFGRR
ncbi:MAG: DNA mismatch repair endonuclease MutL [Dehalococcoidia bacterium]|nr:DNA mismatch repair endonuclease MutL [Dehalococcoidia bacterium]